MRLSSMEGAGYVGRRCNLLIALKRAWPNQIGLVRLIGCRLNGNTFSSCVEEKLRRERDDFAPLALEKRTSAAEAVKRRLFTARLKPCPSLDGVFPELLGSPKGPALSKLASLKNLIWTGLRFSRPYGTHFHAGRYSCRRYSPSLLAIHVCGLKPDIFSIICGPAKVVP